MGTTYGTPLIIRDSLELYLDAGDKTSYPGSGTTWTDIVGSNNGTLTSGPTFSTASGSEAIVFDGNDDLIDVGDIGDVFGTSFTIDLWIYPTEIDDRQEFIGQKVNNQNWWRFGIDELDNWEIDVEVSDSRVVSLNPDFSLVINVLSAGSSQMTIP